MIQIAISVYRTLRRFSRLLIRIGYISPVWLDECVGLLSPVGDHIFEKPTLQAFNLADD